MTEFIPKTEHVRGRYVAHSQFTSSALGGPKVYGEAFDRWLAKVKADALREAATSLIDWDVMYGHDLGTPASRESNRNASWLTSEADRIEKEAAIGGNKNLDVSGGMTDTEQYEVVVPLYIPHGYIMGDEVIQGRAVIHDDTLTLQLNEGLNFPDILKHGRVIALTMALPPKTQNPYGPHLAEQIRAILKPEWSEGRVLPAYVGAESRVRLKAIEALVNAPEEQS